MPGPWTTAVHPARGARSCRPAPAVAAGAAAAPPAAQEDKVNGRCACDRRGLHAAPVGEGLFSFAMPGHRSGVRWHARGRPSVAHGPTVVPEPENCAVKYHASSNPVRPEKKTVRHAMPGPNTCATSSGTPRPWRWWRCGSPPRTAWSANQSTMRLRAPARGACVGWRALGGRTFSRRFWVAQRMGPAPWPGRACCAGGAHAPRAAHR